MADPARAIGSRRAKLPSWPTPLRRPQLSDELRARLRPVAAVALLRYKVGVIPVIAACALAGLVAGAR